MSQSTARLKLSEVARPKPSKRLPRHRLTTASPPQLDKAATPGPEGVAIEQPLQLEQRPAGVKVGSEAEPAMAGGMVNQPDRGHGSGSRSTSSCSSNSRLSDFCHGVYEAP